MPFDSHVEIPVFDNPDRTSADVYQLISDETIQIGKFLYIPQVSFVNGKAVHSFKDVVRKGCKFSYIVMNQNKVHLGAKETQSGMEVTEGTALLTTDAVSATFTGLADVMIIFHPIDRA